MARKSRARRPPGPADERTEKFQDWLAEQLDHKSWPSDDVFERAKREVEAIPNQLERCRSLGDDIPAPLT